MLPVRTSTAGASWFTCTFTCCPDGVSVRMVRPSGVELISEFDPLTVAANPPEANVSTVWGCGELMLVAPIDTDVGTPPV